MVKKHYYFFKIFYPNNHGDLLKIFFLVKIHFAPRKNYRTQINPRKEKRLNLNPYKI